MHAVMCSNDYRLSINLATIIYLMNSPLTGKDSIKFGEDYNLCVLQDHPNFFLPRFETRADKRPQKYHICICIVQCEVRPEPILRIPISFIDLSITCGVGGGGR